MRLQYQKRHAPRKGTAILPELLQDERRLRHHRRRNEKRKVSRAKELKDAQAGKHGRVARQFMNQDGGLRQLACRRRMPCETSPRLCNAEYGSSSSDSSDDEFLVDDGHGRLTKDDGSVLSVQSQSDDTVSSDEPPSETEEERKHREFRELARAKTGAFAPYATGCAAHASFTKSFVVPTTGGANGSGGHGSRKESRRQAQRELEERLAAKKAQEAAEQERTNVLALTPRSASRMARLEHLSFAGCRITELPRNFGGVGIWRLASHMLQHSPL